MFTDLPLIVLSAILFIAAISFIDNKYPKD